MSKHLETAGRENFLLTGRNLQLNQAQGQAATNGVRGKRKKEGTEKQGQNTHYGRDNTKCNALQSHIMNGE